MLTDQINNSTDINAAEKMARLYDQIQFDNSRRIKEGDQALNIFLSRLLFCYFAEDTAIFAKNSFTQSIVSRTSESGDPDFKVAASPR